MMLLLGLTWLCFDLALLCFGFALRGVDYLQDPETKRRILGLATGRASWYDMRRDYKFSGESQTLAPVFLEGVQCRLIGCHLCGRKSHGVNECTGEEPESPRTSPHANDGGKTEEQGAGDGHSSTFPPPSIVTTSGTASPTPESSAAGPRIDRLRSSNFMSTRAILAVLDSPRSVASSGSFRKLPKVCGACCGVRCVGSRVVHVWGMLWCCNSASRLKKTGTHLPSRNSRVL